MSDTATVVRAYCPACEDADPTRETLVVRWCDAHLPALGGADDAVTRFDGERAANQEAGGDANRRWCDLLHRRDPN